MKNIHEEIKQHELWLKSNGREGHRADLSTMSFTKLNLKGVNLSKAILVNTAFIECNLNDANFSHCAAQFSDWKRSELVGADFTNANLAATNFFMANISKAKFDHSDTRNCEFTYAKGK